jgi:hypothetical protein
VPRAREPCRRAGHESLGHEREQGRGRGSVEGARPRVARDAGPGGGALGARVGRLRGGEEGEGEEREGEGRRGGKLTSGDPNSDDLDSKP